MLVFADGTSTRGHCCKLYESYSDVNTYTNMFTNRSLFVAFGILYRTQKLKNPVYLFYWIMLTYI